MEHRTPSQLTAEEWQSISESWKSTSIPLSELAAQYNLNPTTLQSALQRHGIRRNRSAKLAPPLDTWTEEDYSLQAQHDKRVLQLNSQISHWKSLYRNAVRNSSLQDVLVSALSNTVTAWPTPSLEKFKVSAKASHHGLHTVVGLLSDLHVGEVVDPEVMMGMGGYDLDIFRQRVGLWVQNFLRLLDIDRSAREIPRLTLFLDGDFISGLIHDELLKTNAVNIMDQMTMVATAMAWAIREVGRYFEEVHVSCTVGNHGRNQSKVEFKEPYVSWDYLAYQMMAMLLQNDTHITWDIPKSLWAITRVENLDLFHYHGHGKNQNILSIPYYGIERAIKDFREIFQVHDLKFDGVCMGHFHHFYERDLGTGPLIINPCWKGGDEFATLGLRKYSKPSQVKFLVHSKRGYVGSSLIHLWNQKPEHAEQVPLGMGSVWANSVV